MFSDMDRRGWCLVSVLMFGHLLMASAQSCVQDQNCKLPECFCPTFDHPLGAKNVPQIVYFGFDDAIQPQVSGYYKELFTTARKNPNGCPITISLYVSDLYTQYDLVNQYYKEGNEIAVHSVTHQDIDTADKLRREATEQKDNIETKGGVPANKILGWRSPNLKTAGDDQPRVLKELNYEYDISLTYSQDDKYPWPFTLDYGYPYRCTIEPCPSATSSHKGFWEVMVHSMKDPSTGTPCGYVDGCRPEGEDAAIEYLWSNFLKTYENNRAPFGLNMHAAWFATPEYLTATSRFIDRLLETPDVYIVSVEQMMEWIKNPVPVTEVGSFAPWGCAGQSTTPTTKPTTTTSTTPTTTKTSTTTTKATTTKTTKSSTLTEKTIATTKPYIQTNSNQNNVHSFLSWYRQAQNSNPQVWTQKPTLSPTTTNAPAAKIPPAHGSFFWQSLLRGGAESEENLTCIQEVNCKRPVCYCHTNKPPLNVNTRNIPQLVYLAMDTRVDGRTFAPLRRIFSGFRRNPNGCPISGTLMLPASNNYSPYVEALKNLGLRMGVRGGAYSEHIPRGLLQASVESELSQSEYKTSGRFGWRGTASLAPTDEIFRALQEKHALFDSSVITATRDPVWPYTMDFGLKDRCAVLESQCPTDRYPGLWEVPVVPLGLPGRSQTCTFLDTCPWLSVTEESVKQILRANFERHYYGPRAPFGINLNSAWLIGNGNSDGLRGLVSFLDDILQKGDVMVVSVEEMLDWMVEPTTNVRDFPC